MKWFIDFRFVCHLDGRFKFGRRIRFGIADCCRFSGVRRDRQEGVYPNSRLYSFMRQRLCTTFRPASDAISTASALVMPICIQSTFAPTATAC